MDELSFTSPFFKEIIEHVTKPVFCAKSQIGMHHKKNWNNTVNFLSCHISAVFKTRRLFSLVLLIDWKWLKSILPRTWEWSLAGWGGVGMVPSLPFSPLLDARACLFPSLPKTINKNSCRSK